ncbi:MAG: hypothetical protein V1808_04350 [Candidatus Daviesbacteria bacterium]
MRERGGILPIIALGVIFLILLGGVYFVLTHNKTNSSTVTTLQVVPTTTPAVGTPTNTDTPSNSIRLISPLGLGNEQWQLGKTQTILWNQKGLDYWGNQVKVCLFAFNDKQNTILPKPKWKDELCTHKLGTLDGAYLIADTVLTNHKYEWTIPSDLLERFERKPAFFKLSLQVYDNLPSEGRTEWAGLVGDDETTHYFEITGQ